MARSEPDGNQRVATTRNELRLNSAVVTHTLRSVAPTAEQQVPGMMRKASPWTLPDGAAPPASGCDSSDCTYCHKMASQRRLAGRKSVCWLRRKRSENELAQLANAASGELPSSSSPLQVPDVENSSDDDAQGSPSMWDHALLEPETAQRVLSGAGAGASGSPAWQPWRSQPFMAARPLPVAAALHPATSFRSPPAAVSCQEGGDIVCGMEFEEHGWLLATAGVAKQLRVYSLAAGLDVDADEAAPHGPLRAHRLPSKLSSLAWDPECPGVVTVGDYDGVLTQVDLEVGHMVSERDAHAGRRVWSVSHSLLRPHTAASAAEDGRALLWGGAALAAPVAGARPAGGAAATAVHLSPYDEHLMAVGCADSAAYIYDLRRLDSPLTRVAGHTRPVSYVRFMGGGMLATASVDGSLACWELGGLAAGDFSPVRRFRGHTNSKNFVGLSARPEDGLVACGSETSQVFAYSMNWDQPLVAHSFVPGPASPGSRATFAPFCSAVCWQPATACPGAEPLLAAATSDGQLHVLALRQPPADADSDDDPSPL